MNTLKKTALGITLIGIGALGGVSFDAEQAQTVDPSAVEAEQAPDVKTGNCVYDPSRVVEVLGSIDIPEKELMKLAPRDPNTGDPIIIKSLLSENTVEKYFADSVLQGKPAVLGGKLNSIELQKLYEDIARKNGVLVSENIDENGEIDIYKELRK